MRNIFTSRAFILLAFTFFCLLLIVATSNDIGDFQWVGDAALAPFSPAADALGDVARDISDSAAVAGDELSLIEENTALRERIAALEKETRDLAGYRDKIIELQGALNLRGRFADLTTVGANVVTRGVGNWFDVFRLDAGTRSGVGPDMPVVSASMALVGRTVSVGASSSKAITIIDEECAVSGWLSGGESDSSRGGAVIVRGDLTLKSDGLCRVDLIPDDLEIGIGDIVETSGIGGVFPRGIEIGRIESVMQTANGLSRYAIVKPFADLSSIEEVFVLAGHEPGLEAGEVEK